MQCWCKLVFICIYLFTFQCHCFFSLKGGPLHLGEIEDLGEELLAIKCPWHGWRINPTNGKVMFPEGHDLQSTVVYPVKVAEDGHLFIGFSGLDEKYFKLEELDF